MTDMTKKKGSTRTTVRLPEDIHGRAKAIASWQKVSLQDFVSSALVEKLPALEAKMAAELMAAGRKTLPKSA